MTPLWKLAVQHMLAHGASVKELHAEVDRAVDWIEDNQDAGADISLHDIKEER